MRNISAELDRGIYVAHRSFCNGADCDGRARRRCQRCGGVQYDWGCGPSLQGPGFLLSWYCNGRGACGLMTTERLSYKRLVSLRQTPPIVKRARGAPWKRWRTMRATT